MRRPSDLLRPTTRRLASLGAIAMVATTAAACGNDDGASNRTDVPITDAAASGVTTPEEKQSTDAEVTAGLQALPALVTTAAATIGTSAAADAFEPIEASWRTYEGTVRSQEPDIYLAIEDEFANLQKALADGDAAVAEDAQAKIQAAVDEYLTKHP
jgi:hypothetical protein